MPNDLSNDNLSDDNRVIAYRIELPQDGTHQELVEKARALGLPFSRAGADAAVETACADLTPMMHYSVIGSLKDVENRDRISLRFHAAAQLIKGGVGEVPENSRAALRTLRNSWRDAANAIDALLEAKT